MAYCQICKDTVLPIDLYRVTEMKTCISVYVCNNCLSTDNKHELGKTIKKVIREIKEQVKVEYRC